MASPSQQNKASAATSVPAPPVLPLHTATRSGDVHKVRRLIKRGKYDVNSTDSKGQAPLHYACEKGHLDMVRVLVSEFKADMTIQDDSGQTALMLAAGAGHDNVVHALLSEYQCPLGSSDEHGWTVLHYACKGGNVGIVRSLINDHHVYVNSGKDTPIHVAARFGKEAIAQALISEFHCDVNIRSIHNKTVLHSACIGGSVKLVQTLVKNGVGSLDDTGLFPLHTAAQHGNEALVLSLIEEFGKSYFPQSHSLLHCACESGNVRLVQTLIDRYKPDLYFRNYLEQTPLEAAIFHGSEEVVTLLLTIYPYGWGHSVMKAKGDSLLHYACTVGNISLIETLIQRNATSTNAQNSAGQTPLHKAVLHGKEKVARLLVTKYGCDVNIKDHLGNSVLHCACEGGHVTLVQDLVCHYNACVDDKNGAGNTPLFVALSNKREVVAQTLIKELGCDVNVSNKANKSALHVACESNVSVGLVQTLLQEQRADVIHSLDCDNNTPLHIAALKGNEAVTLTLLIRCDAKIGNHNGRTLLHSACLGKNVSLIKTLINKYSFDTNARDEENNTPLQVAALSGRKEMVSALITEIGCEPNIKDSLGRSLLHLACSSQSSDMVATVGKYVSPLMVNDDGDTPLHTACSDGSYSTVKAVLELHPPILLRNNLGKTARQTTNNFYLKNMIDKYITNNQDKIQARYNNLLKQAKKKYSIAECITRIFVIGNPGAGKSSLVETLKREGFLESFRRVSESSVPPHTAGIVPSVHTSKHYGRVLFYDFAGDPEYYSSHAAILENLVSSKQGDNLFIMVVDMREESGKIREILHYWLSFIQHQKFSGREPSLILVGSHSDGLAVGRVDEKRKELGKFCDHIQPGHGVSNKVVHFILDCRDPKLMGDIQSEILSLTKDSPHQKLSLPASVLLMLLENDFSNEPAFSFVDLKNHIKLTGLPLLSLHSNLQELHDIGLLLIVNGSTSKKGDFFIIFNMSKLTNEAHKLLFSSEAMLRIRECCHRNEGSTSSFNIGIISQDILGEILPENITKECLIQLQYCQEISHKDVRAFPSFSQPDSTNQSFLFFPALCSVDKSDVSWVTPPDLSYSIGWLVRCTNPCDYFPPRFLHVLLLRLVFRFTLSASTPNQAPGASPDQSYFQRRCTLWKTGVHWLMEEGVECMVELVNGNKGVVVITKSITDRAENCFSVFHCILSCVMEAKMEFCHPIKPQFFLFDSTNEADYLSEDNLFAMSEVERILTQPEGRDVIVSVTGKKLMERSKLLSMRKLTHWYNLFPIDFNTVLDHLRNIVRDLYDLGRYLGIPQGVLDAIEADFPVDTRRRRRELVRAWLNSSLDPPCWWHLVQALGRIDERVLAKKIQREHSVVVGLQERLLAPQYRDFKPDVEFLASFAGVVGSKWPSLAATLSLSDTVIEEVKKEGLSQQDHTLRMLKWLSREEATYGHLRERLETMSLLCQ